MNFTSIAERKLASEHIDVQVRVEKELAVARHGDFVCAHQAHSVIRDEFEEFWDEVKVKDVHRDKHKMMRELIQVAAMAHKYAEQLYLELGRGER